MFRHYITSINYEKLIEQQARRASFGFYNDNLNKRIEKPNSKVKKISKKQKHC